ncbi:MAG: hypothetical protein ACR2QK_21660 [Acidimicrobiales bacterium]
MSDFDPNTSYPDGPDRLVWDPAGTDDEQLEAILRQTLEPPSTIQREAAIQAFGWRNVDAELAALVSDSRRDDRLVLRADETASAYQLTFDLETGPIAVDLEPSGADTVQGVVLVPDEATYDLIAIRRADGSVENLALEGRAAVIPSIGVGDTFRIELQRDGNVVAVSEWISI